MSRPAGSRYGMCLQEIKLPGPSDPAPVLSELDSSRNIAPLATVSVSSTHPDYSASGLTDGVVDGFPGNISHEWVSKGEQDSAMIRLTWGGTQTIDRIQLFDRPNALDQITSGMLVFSDGTTIKTSALPDDAKQGLEVTFASKNVSWLAFIVTGVKSGSPNIGLSEIAVFKSE